MKAWQHKALREWHDRDRQILDAEGYTVVELSPYHFRVTLGEDSIAVDIWPSKKKLMQVGAYHAARYDKDILNSVAEIFAVGV